MQTPDKNKVVSLLISMPFIIAFIFFSVKIISESQTQVEFEAPKVESANTHTATWLAPVGKNYSLKQNYEPKLAEIGSGYLVTPKTKQALNSLIKHARKKNIKVSIISAYRSYDLQVKVFNDYVNAEKRTGLSKKEAIKKANTYSAKPGESEHQLGTVVDLRCTSCQNFDNSKANQRLYKLLEKNAHKYGFVISYPRYKQKLTGYKSEPWHIRFIGIDLATELYKEGYLNEDSDIYLEKFLENSWEG